MATANTTTSGKSAQTTTRLSNGDIPKAIERYCSLFPDALQPSRTESSVIGNGRYIALANISGTLVYMTSSWNFIERIAGPVLEGESQLPDAALYALAKQVPDLADRGCTISTAYGDITIPPGRMAARLAEFLHREISRGGLQ